MFEDQIRAIIAKKEANQELDWLERRRHPEEFETEEEEEVFSEYDIKNFVHHFSCNIVRK